MAKLRCRVGDTAMIGAAGEANTGRLVLVLGRGTDDGDGSPRWAVRSLGAPLVATDGTGRVELEAVAHDFALTPIRDEPGKDEMLRITGKPKRKKVTA